MKQEEYFDKVRHLNWLEGLVCEYTMHLDLIQREQENFVVTGIGFRARGDERVLHLNSHMTIPFNYVLDGLKEASRKAQQEYETLKSELKSVVVEL